MDNLHPNIELLQRVEPQDITQSHGVFSEDVVWHFFNPRIPELQGDYVGLSGIQDFFEKVSDRFHGAFRVKPVATTAVGDELVVVQSVNTVVHESQEVEIDVVVVWRIVDDRITEVWDIPSVHSLHVHKV